MTHYENKAQKKNIKFKEIFYYFSRKYRKNWFVYEAHKKAYEKAKSVYDFVYGERSGHLKYIENDINNEEEL